MGVCNSCWTIRQGAPISFNVCETCSRNPKYGDHYMPNPVTCKFYYSDCIYDPGYVFVNNPALYYELYGDKNFRDAVEETCKHCTKENCQYDNGDK